MFSRAKHSMEDGFNLVDQVLGRRPNETERNTTFRWFTIMHAHQVGSVDSHLFRKESAELGFQCAFWRTILFADKNCLVDVEAETRFLHGSYHTCRRGPAQRI